MFSETKSREKAIWVTPPSFIEISKMMKGTLGETLAIHFTECTENSLTARMPIHSQYSGLLHGGASAALAETVGSVAANHCVDRSRKICLGLDLNINHIKSVSDGHVSATARPFHVGKTTQVWEILIHNDQKRLIAVARLTLAVIDKTDE